MPALLVGGLPAEPVDAAAALGVPFDVFGAVRGGALQADFDLPRGTSWRLLGRGSGLALWVGRDANSERPPSRRRARSIELDLTKALLALAEIELAWLSEGSVLDAAGTWGPAATGETVLRMLAAERSAQAVAGTWGDARGRAVQAEIYRDGRIWAETHTQAERWLLAAVSSDQVGDARVRPDW
jgi:hypothetical protein